MRVALALAVLLAAGGCKSQSQSKSSTETASTPAREQPTAPMPAGAPPPPGHTPIDHARATGVLGPTEGSAFAPLDNEGADKSDARGTGAVGALPAPKPGQQVRGTVTITEASTAEVEQAALKHIDRIQACYDRALAAAPKITGVLPLTLAVDAAGKITSTQAGKATIIDPGLVKCATAAVRSIALPRGAAGKVSLVLSFEPR